MTAGKINVTAIAKEKDGARREHNLAIAQGYMTGLVEHVTDDSKRRYLLPSFIPFSDNRFSLFRLPRSPTGKATDHHPTHSKRAMSL